MRLSATIALLSAGLAVHAMPANLKTRQLAQVVTSCSVPNTAALTFDDGPYQYIHEITDTLDAAGAKGTFFFNGNNFGCIYDSGNVEGIQYAFQHGHQLASHTWSHADLSTLSWDQNHDEFWRVEQALMRIAGVRPAFMRPPYGSYNDLVLQVAANRGQKVSLWDFDSGDSTGASAEQSKQAYSDLANNHPSTILALNHETQASTAFDILPFAISELQNAGYNLVTLAECLGEAPYQSFHTPESGPFSC